MAFVSDQQHAHRRCRRKEIVTPVRIVQHKSPLSQYGNIADTNTSGSQRVFWSLCDPGAECVGFQGSQPGLRGTLESRVARRASETLEPL